MLVKPKGHIREPVLSRLEHLPEPHVAPQEVTVVGDWMKGQKTKLGLG